MRNVVNKASAFAAHAHASQKRKYTGEPYVVHLQEVAHLIKEAGMNDYVIAAAWLHDTLEDTSVTEKQLRAEFGDVITDLVLEVTDKSKPEDGNRAKRKEIDAQHLSRASFAGASIKLADLISNTKSITQHDPNFARVYLKEKRRILDVLPSANAYLRRKAESTLKTALIQLGATNER